MDAAFDQLHTLLDLEARHDDLLRRLDELDQRINAVLAEYQPCSRRAPSLPSRQEQQTDNSPGDQNQGLRDAA